MHGPRYLSVQTHKRFANGGVDANRQILLGVGVPQRLVALLKAYSRHHPYNDDAANAAISIPDLKLVRTSIGLLLNASFFGM